MPPLVDQCLKGLISALLAWASSSAIMAAGGEMTQLSWLLLLGLSVAIWSRSMGAR